MRMFICNKNNRLITKQPSLSKEEAGFQRNGMQERMPSKDKTKYLWMSNHLFKTITIMPSSWDLKKERIRTIEEET
jgi:CRISPR/Cas system-associated protein Cas10 (large subunit of type III CRISPR-Cas system)